MRSGDGNLPRRTTSCPRCCSIFGRRSLRRSRAVSSIARASLITCLNYNVGIAEMAPMVHVGGCSSPSIVATTASYKHTSSPGLRPRSGPGATGCSVKSVSPPARIEAVREVHVSGAPMSASVAGRVNRTFGAVPRTTAVGARARAARRADHERRTLFISVNTGASHVKQIYQTACALSSRSGSTL